MTKKFTAATAKSFIRKNTPNLKIKIKSSYDCMRDGIECMQDAKFMPVTQVNFTEHTQGISGVWMVGRGNDYFTPRYEADKLIGFECYNSCGTFELSI